MLGVAFISGTFVLTDTLNNTFTVLFGSIYQNIDFQVRGVAQLGSGANATRNELPESLLATVRRVPGVAAAQGQVGGYAQFVAHDGKAIQTGGAPTLGVSFDLGSADLRLHIVAGGPPLTADDVVMDAGTASKYHFTVGQRVRILSAGPVRTFTITGIAQFGSATTSPERPWPRSRCRPRRTSSRRRAASTTSDVVTHRARARPRSSGPSPGSFRAGWRWSPGRPW